MGGLIGNTDASGQLGRRVAERLAGLGVPQRLFVEDAADGRRLSSSDGMAIATYADVASVARAVEGVETLFFVPMREHAERVSLHRSAIDTAVAAGVRRIVYASFLNTAPEATFTFSRDHHATEEHIRSTGVPYTFLRGSPYLEVLRYIIGPDGVIRGPAGDGRIAPVARDDMADATVAVLTADGAHAGRTYDITGPESLSLHDVAAAFTRATGRDIVYVEETEEEAWATRRAYGAPEWGVAGGSRRTSRSHEANWTS